MLFVVCVPALLNRPASLHTSQVGVQTDRKDEVVFTKDLSYTDPPCIVVCGVGACKSVYLVLCVSPSSFSSLLKARHGTRGGGGAGRETQLEGRDFLREYW